MKAITIVPQTKNVQLVDWPEPKIETATQVKVRVLEVGICGTDREEVSGGRSDAPIGEKTLVIGHEMLGEIVEVGTGVKNFKPKDLVVIMVRRPCSECEMCKKGCADMCQSGNYTERGIKQRHGFHAEFVVDEEKYLIAVPASIKNLAVLTEPTTVVEKAIDHACRLQVARLPVDPDPKKFCQGKKVLVAGLGPIGVLAAMVFRLRGADVTGMDVVDPRSLRPRILEAMGGKYVLAKQENTRGQKFDIILEAAGIPKLDFELPQFLSTNGVYVLTGVAADGPPLSFDAAKMMRNLVLENQIIFGSVNAGLAHFKQAVADLEEAEKKWSGTIGQLITSRTPHAQFADVLEKRKPDEIKAVIEWS
ncbi:MAG: alcohol dehydrogenase [Chlamydiae bacterium CG10_big_fil_rev_8_21_14_0_10_42_34]|nr:MAG: alcohol dehydrogenase [Chlamydiae bacterium CG10_big_fil_rev_8_21_14_0_10_42_34]